MATTKTKGTNSKIKELKANKPEKVSEQELAQLQSSIKTIEKLTKMWQVTGCNTQQMNTKSI